ncbi:MAG: NifU family protein [Holosporaceae bacterium]|jgi:Fe-S cluster biogenesis protein NfuA|nr:NifU family protein [Holosporaceae bacterium]
MDSNQALLKKITEVVDQHIRPSLNLDGGDIDIVALDGNILSVKLQGVCSKCPHAQETLKYGIKKTLNQLVSEDLVVVPVEC